MPSHVGLSRCLLLHRRQLVHGPRSVFDAAAYTGEYFQNQSLFSDYFLRDRLREDPAWRDNPSDAFAFVRNLLRDAQRRWTGKNKDTLKNELLEPLFKKLGFKAKTWWKASSMCGYWTRRWATSWWKPSISSQTLLKFLNQFPINPITVK